MRIESVNPVNTNRRSFVEGVVALGLSGYFGWTTGRARIVSSVAELHVGTANVRDFGATGDGRHDDTQAFALAIRSFRGAGGMVIVPNGVYLIDPTRSVVLTDNLTLRLNAGATLQAIPTHEGHSAVIVGRSVQNVAVLGGTVVGERVRHQGTTGEWGMGLEFHGCVDVRIEDATISSCWGDGIYVGTDHNRESQRVTINRCTSHSNRRQGLSITGCRGVLIQDSDFSDTSGTAPQCGIDIEPKGQSVVRDVTILRCTALRNVGYGIVVSGNTVDKVEIRDSRVASNTKGGVLVSRAVHTDLARSVIESNGGPGITVVQRAHETKILGNTITGNGRSSIRRYDNVYLDRGCVDTRINDNVFVRTGSDPDPARFDIRINSRDCLRTEVLRNRLRPPTASSGGVYDHGTGTMLSAV